MPNKINLEKCDAFELSEIANHTLTEASGYFFHLYMEELKKEKPDNGVLTKHKWDFNRVGALLQDGIGNLNKENLIQQIRDYAEYAQKFKALSDAK